MDRLKYVKSATISRINRLIDSIRLMAVDAQQGFNVDDTEVRQKLTAIEEFYSNTFGEAFSG